MGAQTNLLRRTPVSIKDERLATFALGALNREVRAGQLGDEVDGRQFFGPRY